MFTEENIQKALESLLGEEPLLPLLTAVLDAGRRQESFTYKDTQRLAGEEAAEVLLLAWDWKKKRRIHYAFRQYGRRR